MVNSTRVDPWANSGEHDHHLTVNMKKGQKGHDHLFPLFEDRPECPGLRLQGNEIAMGQHGRLGKPGRPPGVGQDRQVFPGINGNLGGLGGIFFQQVLKGVNPGFVERFHCGGRFPAHWPWFTPLPNQFLQGRKVFLDTGQDHPLQRDSGLLQVIIEDVLADGRLGLAVLDLMSDFDTGVDWADGRDLGPQPESGEIGNDILGAVQEI